MIMQNPQMAVAASPVAAASILLTVIAECSLVCACHLQAHTHWIAAHLSVLEGDAACIALDSCCDAVETFIVSACAVCLTHRVTLQSLQYV